MDDDDEEDDMIERSEGSEEKSTREDISDGMLAKRGVRDIINY